MLRLVARQVLERLICECIDSGSLDVDGDGDRAFNFAHLARIGWRNWCGSCGRGSSIGGVAAAACGLDVVGDGDRAFKFRPFGRNWMAKLVWQLLERQLYRRRGRYVCFDGSLWSGCCWRRR
ncbi:uncharacterized protein [Drosophila pseudoobscura]|uniref:Uncharacterized protein isoform X4 n=1 Tax=Drosophila pseudoobscura pseudoobscura TaxID=46245 RepID=A0A6I8VWF0_DROPS|nr:uncharacterized protein LOC26532503 isoform X4 [Drosophila pseudoobscura]